MECCRGSPTEEHDKAEEIGESRSVVEALAEESTASTRVVAPYTRCHWMLLRLLVVGCGRARWGSVDPAWWLEEKAWAAGALLHSMGGAARLVW